MKKLVLFFLSFFLLFYQVNALEMEVDAKSAILIDQNTGTILYHKNEHERLPMASMTKIMSLLLIMEELSKGNINYDTKVEISDEASSMGGSQIFLKTGDVYKMGELLKSIAMASANDAVVALAEKTYGSKEEFINKMNEKVEELGLKNTHFMNVHGLDEENHYSSAYDMAMIARELLKYEDILKFTSVYEEYLQKSDGSKIWLVNTNKLVRFYKGVDGFKTGYTKEALYCLTATIDKGFRVIAVVMGEPSTELRNKEVSEMIDYAYAQYKLVKILNKDDTIGEYMVEKGKNKNVTLVPSSDVTVLNKKLESDKNYTYNVNIDKLVAPINVGDKVGTIDVIEDGNIIKSINITVKDNVKKANILELYFRYLKEIIVI